MTKLLTLLLIIGFLISIYLTYGHYTSNIYICPVGNNCDKVLKSKYSEIFNIPISLVGTVYFLIVLILFILKIIKIVKILIFAGFLAGLILIYLQVFVLHAICFYCFVVDSILLILPIVVIYNNLYSTDIKV